MNTLYNELLQDITSSRTLIDTCKLLDIPLVYIGFDEDIKLKKDGAYIINLGDPINNTHWVGLFKKGKKVFYFDSFGLFAPETIESKIKRTKRYKFPFGLNYHYNPYKIQKLDEGLCGTYVILFLFFIKSNPTLVEYKEFLNLFLNNYQSNPEILEKLLNSIFTIV